MRKFLPMTKFISWSTTTYVPCFCVRTGNVKTIGSSKTDEVNCDAYDLVVDLIIDLCSYVAPKLRSVEITQESENPFSITLNLSPKKKEVKKEVADEKKIDHEDHEEMDIDF